MVMKKALGGVKVFVVAFALGILSVVLFSSLFSSPLSVSSSDYQESSLLNYRSMVCVYKNGEVVDCSHNILFNNGRNITRDLLGSAVGNPVQVISLCNANASGGCATPTADGLELYSTLTNCGLANATGTYATLQNAPGNWTLTKTFTSLCDNVLTNVTRLVNGTGGIFAGNSFTLVTLQTNDQLTINWTLMIT